MMRWIISSCLQARLLVLASAAALVVFGVMQLPRVPVDALPDFTRPYVELQTEALGLSAEEVESMITTPMEADMLSGTPWVDEILSESMPGLSRVKMIFEPGTDIMNARQMVQEHLTQVYMLPQVSKPPVMLQPVASANRCLKVGLSSDKLSLIQMSVLARWTVKPRLMGVPGVANISIWGQRERQLQVLVDPQQLEKEDVSLNQIIETTGNSLFASHLTFLDASVPGTGGFIDTPNQRLTVMHRSPIKTAKDLAEVVIAGTNKSLKDVAQVVEDHQPLIGDAQVNDAPALMLVVEKFPWSNTVEVTRKVEAALAALAPAVEGMKMDASMFRPATYIETAMGNMTSKLLLSGALVALALLVLMGNWRSSVVGIFAILTSVVTAGLVLYVLGVQVNLLIIAGLLVGVVAIIDDAVVDAHNIARRLRQYRERGSVESVSWVIREAMVEMRCTLMYSTMIVLLALVPVFFMQGVSGAFLQPIGYAYALAVIASLLVGLIVTPAVSLMLFDRKKLGAEDNAITGSIRRAYEGFVKPSLNRPAVAFTVVAALVVAAAVLVPKMRQESLYPTFNETEVVVSLDAKPGTSHPAMSKLVAEVGHKLRGVAGVKSVGAHIGRAVGSDQVADVNSAELWASIDPSADHAATLAAIKKAVDGSASGLEDHEVNTYLAERIQEEMHGQDRGLVVRVYGENLTKVESLANDVVSKLKTTDGLINVKVEAPFKQPRIEIEPDLDKCTKHGIKPGDVRRTASILLSGIQVGSLFDEQKVFEVVVWGKPDIRKDVENVKNLMIEIPDESPVPLKDLADVRMGEGPTVINREAVARYIDVTADVSGRDLGAIGSDVKKVLAQIQFPLEYRAELLGASAERLANQERVLAYAIAGLIVSFLLLQVVCNSWRVASLVMLMLPLSMVGGLAAIYVTGGIISYGSVLGFIALLAIAARGCVLLVHRYQQLGIKHEEPLDSEAAEFDDQSELRTPLNDVGGFDGICPDLVLAGTRQRFVPYLVSTAAISLACAPFVLTDTIAGLEILRPMAIVVLGGSVTAALVNLYVLPALYLWLKVEPLSEIVTEPLSVTKQPEPAIAV